MKKTKGNWLLNAYKREIDRMTSKRISIEIYTDDAVVYSYETSTPEKAREHAAAIIATGLRSTTDQHDDLVWYPPHRIVKVVIRGGATDTKYRMKVRAT